MKLVGKKQFSSLFSENSEITNKKFKDAIQVLRLKKYTNFESVEKNYQNLRQNYNLLPGVIGRDENKSKVMDVWAVGDCAFLSLLSPLLGYVPDREDKGGEVKTFRRALAAIVEEDPNQFVTIFGTMENLLKWTEKVRMPRKWDGTDVFSVFSKITKIVVHSINLSSYVDKGTLPRVSHYVPNRNTEDWSTSIVVRFVNDNHYQCVIPQQLPATVSVTIISSGNQESPEMDLVSEDEEPEEKWKRVPNRRKTRFPKGLSQRERKETFSKPGTAGDWSFMMPERKAKDVKAPPRKKYESWVKNRRKNRIVSDESSDNPDDPDTCSDANKSCESNADEDVCESSSNEEAGGSTPKEGGESISKEEGDESSSKKKVRDKNYEDDHISSNTDASDNESKKEGENLNEQSYEDGAEEQSENDLNQVPPKHKEKEAGESSSKEGGESISKEGDESSSKKKVGNKNFEDNDISSNTDASDNESKEDENLKEESEDDLNQIPPKRKEKEVGESSSKEGGESSSKKKVGDKNTDVSDNEAKKEDENLNEAYEAGTEEESEDDLNQVPPKNKSSKSRSKLKIKPEWFTRTDVNGHKVSSYLRRVPDNLCQVFCSVDSTHIKVGSRGFSAVSDHIKTDTHKHGMEIHSSQLGIGHYASKHAATKNNQAKALMRLLLFVTNHNVAFDNIHCLIECCKAAFGDSEIAQSLKMGSTSATYHLIFGLAKTELDFTCKDLQTNPFCSALDCGTKGNMKRLEVHVRYWSDSLGRIVEKYWHTETTNQENALSVTAHFLTPFEERGIPLQNLIMCHCDNCAILRGKKSGALLRISAKAPQVLDCDVGGDGLHRMHNSNKKASKEVFGLVDKVLKNIKYDIRSSPAKVEIWIESAKIVGDSETMPESMCSSRWLDKFTAGDDLLTKIETAKHFYENIPEPKGKKTYFTESETESSEDEDLIENLKSKKKENEDGIKKTKKNVDEYKEMLLIINRDCMKSSFDFLRVFQSAEVKIHLLFPAYEQMMYETLLEIVEPAALKNSKGERLSGKEMKVLVLETSEERKERKEQEARGKNEESKGTSKKKKGKVMGFIRRAQLLPVKDTMLGSKLRKDLKILLDRYDIQENEVNENMEKAKSLRSRYNVALVKAFQHYLPLDNDFLRYLKYLCPKKAMESPETEAYFVKIAEKLPTIEDDEVDDIRREIRILQGDKHKHLPELQTYNENFVDGFQLKEDKEKNLPIDFVWRPVILNIEKFPVMSKMLKASLSIFHGTASVEGSINTTRNILGDRSHSLKDKTLQAKKLVKSATKVNPNKCCYDFQLDDPNYLKDWCSAHANCQAFKVFNNIPDDFSDDDQNESVHDSHNRRGVKRKTEMDCNAKDDEDKNENVEVKKKKKHEQKMEKDDNDDVKKDQNRNRKKTSKIKKKRKNDHKVNKDDSVDLKKDQNRNQKKTKVKKPEKKGASNIDKDSSKQNFQKEPKVQKKLLDFFHLQ